MATLKPRTFLAVALSAMGVSVIVQALAFLRQLLIAAYFGVSRDLDVYLIAYAIATMVVFTFSTAFDSAIVPRLVRAGSAGGDEAASALAASLFRWSCGLAFIACLLMVALTPLLSTIVATGFDDVHRRALADLIWHFLPWAFLSLPYYAAAARHKAVRNFNRVFAAEIVIGAVSIAVLLLWHADVRVLPWAYAAGYVAALACVLPGSGIVRSSLDARSADTHSALRNVGELYVANQTGSVTTLVDRHYQSLVAPGGIAAVGYSSQIVTGLMGLLTFREIYIVPLAEPERRAEKLERLIIGLLVVAVPVAAFFALMAHDIVTVLFQRGRFDTNATALTSSVLAIMAVGLIPSAISNPLVRMLQIVDRIRLIHINYVANVVLLGVFGFGFVRALGWDADGLAWMLVLNSVGSAVVTAVLVRSCGITLSWRRIAGFGLFIAATSGVATSITALALADIDGAWLRLVVGGLCFGAITGLMYLPIRGRLRAIAG